MSKCFSAISLHLKDVSLSLHISMSSLAFAFKLSCLSMITPVFDLVNNSSQSPRPELTITGRPIAKNSAILVGIAAFSEGPASALQIEIPNEYALIISAICGCVVVKIVLSPAFRFITLDSPGLAQSTSQ